MRRLISCLLFLFAMVCVAPSFSEDLPKFFPDDPVLIDPDNMTIPKPPEVELSQIFDFIDNTFIQTRKKDVVRAVNINTLGEVPDSSWFTNRMGKEVMTIEELVRGPNRQGPPDTSGPWVVTRAKTQGITPGFTIKDPKGVSYFIKFDPAKYPQLSTSTEVISTKFFYAFGYNVPENYLAILDTSLLQISPEAKITDEEGIRRSMTEGDLEGILRKVPRLPDGRIQVVASLRLDGEPIGPFQYYGTRSDDPNDIFPHEHRRELRGLRLFSAWLNHDDSRSINSLDMYVTDGDKKYVKHHLIDFGSTLGSGSIKPQGRRAGNEYIIEWGPIAKAGLTLGLWDRPWRHVEYPDYKAIGRFESKFFQPEKWRPEYPNPAFLKMDAADAFWAARIMSRFSDEMVREIVKAGELSEQGAEDYLVATLIERRDKTIRHYLAQVNALDEFTLDGSGDSRSLRFIDLAVETGAAQPASYEYQWFRFDNQTRALDPLGQTQTATGSSIPVPTANDPFLMARIYAIRKDGDWKKKVDVYIRNNGEPNLVGIERE